MTTIHLVGRITESGQLEVELPPGLPPGQAQITLEISSDPDDQPLTEEEIEELLRPNPMTGKQIVESGLLGGWEHKGITDSRAWVEEQRRKRSDQHTW